LIFAGAGGAALLTLLSSKYWIERHQIVGIPLKQFTITVGSVILPFGLGLVAAVWLGYWMVKQASARAWFLGVGGILLFSVAAGTVGTTQLVKLTQDKQPKVYSPDVTEEVRVEKGFTVTLFSNESFHLPTSLRFGPDGQLYVSDYNGDIWAVPVQGGAAGHPRLFAQGFLEPVGLAWRGNDLYVASHGIISIARDTKGSGHADQIKDILTGLPSRVYDWHSNYGMAFGPDGRLYFPLGSTSDSSPETDKYAGSILSANPDGSDLRIFAKGVRNPFSVAFNSAGDLFATDNGPDTFTVTPPDELNYIVEGGDYGFPRYFGIPPAGSGTRAPIALFPAHASADGIAFYQANQFPPAYKDNAFVVAFHRGELYRVQLAKAPGGDYVASLSMFANGFDNPLDLTVGPDGSLYVATWGGSAIYRISYHE
jgi:glucose/arabinose dehydrogenase